MPPVLGPSSPSSARLKSCAGTSGHHVDAVGQDEQRDLGAVEVLLDDDPAAGLGQARGRVRERLVAVVGDDDALARGEPVVLDHVGGAERVERRRRPRRASSRRAARRSARPAAAMTSLANALEPSSRAPAADGPNTGIPAARTASATPATSGASGPTTTRSAPSVGRRARRPRSRPAGRPRAAWRARRCPGLPGAACSAVTAGSRDSARTSACSRAPVPTTRIFTVGEPTDPGAPAVPRRHAPDAPAQSSSSGSGQRVEVDAHAASTLGLAGGLALLAALERPPRRSPGPARTTSRISSAVRSAGGPVVERGRLPLGGRRPRASTG